MMKNSTLSPKSVSRDVIKRLGIVTPKKGRADAATPSTHYKESTIPCELMVNRIMTFCHTIIVMGPYHNHHDYCPLNHSNKNHQKYPSK